MTKASDLFIQCLEEEGVEYIFGVPGEENLDFLDSLSRSARRTQRDVRRRAERMGAAARERYEAASESVRAGYHRARRKAVEFSGDVDEYVRENPGKAILIAAGVGFVIGLLVRGGRRRDDD